jgi:hypothetical protein
MRSWVFVFVLCCLAAPAVFGQVFENILEITDVPGIGPMRARVGVSPGPLVQCEVRSRFAAGRKITTPLVAYIVADRTSTHTAPYTFEFIYIRPDGPYVSDERSFRFDEGVVRKCHTRQFDSGAAPFQFQWMFNGVEVGGLSFDKD